jgi:2-polyprenyl-6-methoxyphenol hydroxylase-like FAD-dependent oxidoreductase
MTIETPILIVGGGSVGLALACDLGGRGVPCPVVEQNERPADHPRATAVNARSMEFMRRWGVADAVRQAAAPEDYPHTALYCTSLNGFEPDGHVAWRSDDPPADPLALADCVRGADRAAFATAANTEALPVGT